MVSKRFAATFLKCVWPFGTLCIKGLSEMWVTYEEAIVFMLNMLLS